MSEQKHTPAPWYIRFLGNDDHDNGENDFFIEADNNRKKVGHATEIMQDDYGEHNGYPREQRLADAKLISAAPDMLEVLKSICGIEAHIADPEMKKLFQERVYAVIEKAEGK